MSKISRIEEGFTQKEVPQFEVGDTVDVHVRIMEGEKERIQVFNGTVIRKRGAGMSATYTVRRIVQGQGVERIFPMHSPFVAKVEVRRAGRVRRSRLYYLRERRGKATRLREIIRPQGRTEAAPREPAEEVTSTSENAPPAAEGQELS